MIVVDTSVLLPALVDDGRAGSLARARLRGEQLFAPAVIDLELCSVLRRMHRERRLSDRRCEVALDDLRALPLARADHGPLLDTCWRLRHNLSPYDASYVALAAALDAPLITADRRLSGSGHLPCAVELLPRTEPTTTP